MDASKIKLSCEITLSPKVGNTVFKYIQSRRLLLKGIVDYYLIGRQQMLHKAIAEKIII